MFASRCTRSLQTRWWCCFGWHGTDQANNGNVRLFHGDNAAEQESTPFQLELLSLQDADNMSGSFAPTTSTKTTTATATTTTTTANSNKADNKNNRILENAPPAKGKGVKGGVKNPKAGARKRVPGRDVGNMKGATAIAQPTA